LCIWISANKEHTAEVFWKVEEFLRRAGVAKRGQAGKELARVLPNGSRIVGLAARDATVRGYTATFLVMDEAAQVEDAVFNAASAVLAVNRGTLWVMSTPRERKGRFWEIWEQGGAEWLKSRRTSLESGRVSKAFLDGESKVLSCEVMRREYECEFVEIGRRKMLQTEDVRRLFQ
jgi:hypothetical protein